MIAGHAPPLLLRQGRVVKELTRRPNAPLGLRLNDNFTVHKEVLEPGHRLVVYSDGVVEAMDATTGERFGIERLVDFVARAEAAGEPVPQTMRRLGRRGQAPRRRAPRRRHSGAAGVAGRSCSTYSASSR